MDDVEPLLAHLSRQIELTSQERALVMSLASIKPIKRRQYIDQPGFVSRYRTYVVRGAFRAFVMGTDGQEHTISLAIEDSWIGDPGSYFLQQPATFFVEALEDGLIIQLSYEHEQLLLERIPKFHSYFRLRAQLSGVNIQKRLLTTLTQSAEERYDAFATQHPNLLQRFPLYVIASYLGMTREFLSKIRNARINVKNNVK